MADASLTLREHGAEGSIGWRRMRVGPMYDSHKLHVCSYLCDQNCAISTNHGLKDDMVIIQFRLHRKEGGGARFR